MPREMPKFEKSAPELVARFSAVLDRNAAPDITRRQMFGYPCAWINGNMLSGLFAQDWARSALRIGSDGLTARWNSLEIENVTKLSFVKISFTCPPD